MADDFKSLTDEELVRMWDNEDAKNALYCRMLPTLYKLIAPFNAYGIQGYDYDDCFRRRHLRSLERSQHIIPGKMRSSAHICGYVCARICLILQSMRKPTRSAV